MKGISFDLLVEKKFVNFLIFFPETKLYLIPSFPKHNFDSQEELLSLLFLLWILDRFLKDIWLCFLK